MRKFDGSLSKNLERNAQRGRQFILECMLRGRRSLLGSCLLILLSPKYEDVFVNNVCFVFVYLRK
jgi:hypothetical protein